MRLFEDDCDPAPKPNNVLKTKKAFDWSGWQSGGYPELSEHSKVKLEILHEYLVDYICILCNGLPHGAPEFSFYLIDGFCGGGKYDDGSLGSPFVILQAIEEASLRINLGRKSPLLVRAMYFFVDDSKEAVSSLQHELVKQGYKDRIGKDIFLKKGDFQEEYQTICSKLSSLHPRGGARAIFLLDQCGYGKVRPQVVRSIMKLLPNSEFIINFAITWLSDFLAGGEGAQQLLESTGLDDEVSLDELKTVRATEGKTSWAWTVESRLSTAYQTISGMPFFSPFYISPADNHRGYWLLHLAPHHRARQAMVSVQWRMANRIRHFGKSGLNILAYKPDEEEELYLDGTSFGDFEREIVNEKLEQDLLELISTDHSDGIPCKELMENICNGTNADKEMIIQSLNALARKKEVSFFDTKGKERRSEKLTASLGDVVSVPSQKWFSGLGL